MENHSHKSDEQLRNAKLAESRSVRFKNICYGACAVVVAGLKIYITFM